MVRNFRAEPIDDESVERIVTAGLQGPSAGFSQGFAFLALESSEDREQFWATNEHNVRDRPFKAVLKETSSIFEITELSVEGEWPDTRFKMGRSPQTGSTSD